MLAAMPSMPPTPAPAGRLAPEQTHRSEIFYDHKVLRAGWGILLFLIVVLACIAAQNFLLARFAQPSIRPHGALALRDFLAPPSALTSIVYAVAITLATWVLSTREQRRFTDYGLRGPRALRMLLGGALSGLVLLTALVLLLHQQDLLVFRGQVLFGIANQWKLGLTSLGFYALVTYVTETFTRGYLQYTLTRGLAWMLRRYFAAGSGVQLAFWIAALLLSALSTLAHLLHRGESSLGICNAGILALLLAYSLWRTGSLWWAFGFHSTWNWTQSFLWGVPHPGMQPQDHLFLTEATGSTLRSGGSGGPESSLYALGAYLAAFGILMLLHKRRVYPELWDEASRDARETTQTLPDPGRFARP